MNPKKRFLSRAAVAALLTTFVAVGSLRADAPAIKQIVCNSDFETTTGAVSWTTTAGGPISLSSSVAHFTAAVHHGGSYSAEVAVTTPQVDGVAQDLTGKMIPGRSYLVSAWVKLASSTAARLGLHISATANGIVNPSAGLVEQPISDAGADWHYVGGAFELDTNAAPTALALLITGDDVATNFYVDDVAVSQLPATGIFNAPASEVSTLGAGAVRVLVNLFQFEDNLNAAAVTGSTWSAASSILSQTSPYLSATGNLLPSAPATNPATWSNYTLSVGVRFDSMPIATNEMPLGNASLRFAVGAGLTAGQGYLLTISPTKLVLSKYFPSGTQVIATVNDMISTAAFHNYAVTFDTTNGIAVARDGMTKIPDGITMMTRPPVDPSLTVGSIGIGTANCTASFDALNVTSLGGTLGDLFTDSFASTANWTLGNQTPFAALAALGSLGPDGVPVVFTLRTSDPRNQTPISTGKTDQNGKIIYDYYTKIPTTSTVPTAAKVQTEIQNFIGQYGKYISIFAVENEPNNEYTVADRTVSGGTAPAIAWMQTVASTVKAAVAAIPSLNGSPKVASGAMTQLLNAYSDPSYRTGAGGLFLQAMLNQFNTDSNIDFIDFHAHQASEEAVEQDLAYLQGQTSKPLIATEWSEAPAVTASWLGQPISADDNTTSFVPSAPGITTSSTNKEYIKATYLSPVPLPEWNDFVGMSALGSDLHFLQNVTDLYNRNGVAVETYGDYDQFGGFNFDMKSLYANMTVELDPSTHGYQPNATYLTQFNSLTPTLTAPDDQIHFENFQSGDSAWTTSGGTWSVMTGADQYLQQTATSGVSDAVIDSGTVAAAQDIRVAAEITPVAVSGSGNSVGLLARYTNTPSLNYYSALYHGTGSDTLVIQKVSGGSITALATKFFTLPAGSHRFELDVQGGTLTFSIDYKTQLQVTDTGTPLPAGQVGFLTNNTTANFDNVDVRQPQYVDDFSTTLTPNWTTSGGSWSAGSGVYSQTSTSNTAVAYLAGLAWSDYTVETQVTPIEMDTSANSIGLLARRSSGTSFYALVYRHSASDMVLLKDVSGAQTVLADLPIDLTIGQTYALKLEVRGSQIRGYLNGRMICSEQDTDLGSGTAGVSTFNSKGNFAHVVVTQLNVASP